VPPLITGVEIQQHRTRGRLFEAERVGIILAIHHRDLKSRTNEVPVESA
jgi:hypothetical protein